MNSPTDDRRLSGTADNDQGLTGQQLAGLQKRMTEVVQEIRNSVDLRKQCLEMAIRAMPAHANGDDVMDLADKMLAFMTDDTVVVKVTIDPPT